MFLPKTQFSVSKRVTLSHQRMNVKVPQKYLGHTQMDRTQIKKQTGIPGLSGLLKKPEIIRYTNVKQCQLI